MASTFYSVTQRQMKAWLFVSVFVFNYFEKGCRKKVHATIPKGIVGGFEFTVLRRNLKEWHERPRTYVYQCERKATKLDSTATVSGTVYWPYPILPFGIVACTFFPTTFLEIAVYFKRLRTTRARVTIGTRKEGFLPTLRVSPAIFTRAGVFRSLFYP